MRLSTSKDIAEPPTPHGTQQGILIINADDWGRDYKTTQAIFECLVRRTVSSVSAMVFMEDSERAAEVAEERGIDAGLHLNLTSAFTGQQVTGSVAHHLERVARHLRWHRFAAAGFYPWLYRSIEYVARAQQDEYQRLYGRAPQRIDGHHHMHLSSNILFSKILPKGTVVRRNFSFDSTEKSWINRAFRKTTDWFLIRSHETTDFFFSLAPTAPVERLSRIFELARRFVVEVETHPVQPEEFRLLQSASMQELTRGINMASRYQLN